MQSQRKQNIWNISVIIPAYNEAKNILQVLEPLREVPAIKEIIVVSDGSTDDTVELVRGSGGVKVIALSSNDSPIGMSVPLWCYSRNDWLTK